MVRKSAGERPKYKPRGRPFPKGNKQGSLRDNVVVAPRRESSDRGEVIEPQQNKSIAEPIKEELKIMPKPPEAVEIQQEQETPIEIAQENEKSKVPEPVIMEFLEFVNGNNKLNIVLSKKHNRMYRIQIFLNDKTEIRPSHYVGSSPAMCVWNLLKGSLK